MNRDEELALTYGLMGEAITRAALPDPKLEELMIEAAKDTEPNAPLYEKIAAIARNAFRSGAAAALYLAEQEPERLQQAFRDLLDAPRREEG